MNVEFITKEDLRAFRLELLKDLKQLLAPKQGIAPKEWLKGAEVRKLLSISDGKLQHLRVSGKLHSSKIGGVHYYRSREIQELLENGFSED